MCYRPTLYFLKDSTKWNKSRGKFSPAERTNIACLQQSVCSTCVCMFGAFQAMSMASKAHNYNINFYLLDTALAQRGRLVPFSGCCEEGEVADCFPQRKQHTLAWRNLQVTHKYTKCKNIFAVLHLSPCLSLSLSHTHTHKYPHWHTQIYTNTKLFQLYLVAVKTSYSFHCLIITGNQQMKH